MFTITIIIALREIFRRRFRRSSRPPIARGPGHELAAPPVPAANGALGSNRGSEAKDGEEVSPVYILLTLHFAAYIPHFSFEQPLCFLQPGWFGNQPPELANAQPHREAAQNEGSPSNPEPEEELVAPISENPAGAASSPPADESPQSSEEKIVFQVSHAASYY